MPTSDTHHALNELKHGDLIFIAVPTFLFRQVASATGSWTSHVGLVLRDKRGGFWVYESAIPRARRVTVASFIRRSDCGRYSILRPKDSLSSGEQSALWRAAEARLGQWYDLGFNFDGSRQYCSKFVYECYFEATGRRIGRVQSFGELMAANPEHGLTFWRWWFAGFIPWSRRTISPASQLESSLMQCVATGKAAESTSEIFAKSPVAQRVGNA